MAWVNRNVAAELPTEFASLADSAQSLQGNLQVVADALNAAATVARVFVSTNVDPTSALATAIISEIESVVDDFFSTGFFMLVITPNDLTKPGYDPFGLATMTPNQALDAAVASFDDLGDSRRPQFSDQASVTGFGILATAVSVEDMIDKMSGLISVLNLDGFDLYLRQARRTFPQPPVVPDSVSPDWVSTKLQDIPGFSELHAAVQGFLQQFRGYLTTGDNFLDDFVTAIENKVNVITKAIDELNAAIDRFVGAVGATGVYFLDIAQSTGGNTYLKSQIPDSTLESLTENKYTVMVLFVAGGADTAGMENFKSIFA